MPLYKGSSEVTSGNLYKGSTEIENGYKGPDSFFINETTVSWATPTGGGFTYSTPTPQSSTGSPGTAFTSTTFTITAGSNALTGTATIAGLPTGITSTQSYNNSGPGNILTITISGTFPTTSYLNTALTVSGLSGVTYYTLTFNYSGLSNPGSQQGAGANISASSGGNYINDTNNGSTWTAQYAAGEIANVIVSYSNPAYNTGFANSYEEYYFSGGGSGTGYIGQLPGISGDITSWTSGANVPADVTGFSIQSANVTMTGNKTVTVSGGYSYLMNSIWGYSIDVTQQTSAQGTAVLLVGLGTVGGWGRISRSCVLTSLTNSGVFLSFFTQSGGNYYKSYAVCTIAANSAPANAQVLGNAAGTTVYQLTWGGSGVQTTITFT